MGDQFLSSLFSCVTDLKQNNSDNVVLQELYDMFNRFTVGRQVSKGANRFYSGVSGSKPDSKSDEKSKSTSKSKASTNSAEAKVTTKVKRKKGKKVTEINIKLDKNRQKVADGIEMNAKSNTQKLAKGKKGLGKKERDVIAKYDTQKEQILQSKMAGVNKAEMKSDGLKVKEKSPQHLSVTTERVLRMKARRVEENHLPVIDKLVASKERPAMEMFKVKKAEGDSKKKEELKHELLKDYPENGTVEIVNWEGTFAPMAGEPYVAPLHHQPDSFWDAIYRSTDPDLPTPPGVDMSVERTSAHPQLSRAAPAASQHSDKIVLMHTNNDMVMKGRDKGKKENKKPKLSPKEKKKKKKEKKEEKEKSRLSAAVDQEDLQMKASGMDHISSITSHSNVPLNVPSAMRAHAMNGGPDAHHVSNPLAMHAAGRSEENLKTPSEEERESGTTYKPEGAYEYPSFRHPDFNPDTAYDEHGIPIHESPGWTAPPTLPGDNRFGLGRNSAGLSDKRVYHGPLTLAKPRSVHDNNLVDQHGLHSNLAAVEHQHLAEALSGVQAQHFNGHAENTNNMLFIDPKSGIPHEQAPGHLGVSFILPAQHQGAPIKENINHKIIKRAASAESMESLSSVMSTKELETVAKKHDEEKRVQQYKAYGLTDSELLEKEDSAPLEALNPALYMHRNMLKVRQKEEEKLPLPKDLFDGMPDSAQVVAVVVSPQDSKEAKRLPALPGLSRHVNAIPLHQKPVTYNKENEATNPLLYKHRNMFKVGDLKDDGMKFSRDILKQAALNQAQKKEVIQMTPLEDYARGPQGTSLKGKGRENFNPIFINQHKLFHVKTNKFKATSVENIISKREIKESENPFLYSYNNIFSSNPKQVLPLKDKIVKDKSDNGNSLSRFAMLAQALDPSKTQNTFTGKGVPVVDKDSDEKAIDPKITSYMGRGKEALNPYLVNYPNMFAVKSYSQPKEKEVVKTQGKSLDPSANKYIGRSKENFNPFLYNFPNMFAVNNLKTDSKVSGGKVNRLNNIHHWKGESNPALFAVPKMSQVERGNGEGHKIQKREIALQ